MPTSSQGDIDEVAAKARFWNSATVDARLGATFPGADRRDAAVLLAGLVGEVPGGEDEDSEEATCRLMLAALKLSHGEIHRLGLWVDAGRIDPRDLIAAAEYPLELQDGEAARLADLTEYLDWVSGTHR